MIKMVFFLITFWVPQLFAGGGMVVGNGGEGWRIEGQIWIRDLVESGTHKTPYFGNQTGTINEVEIENSSLDLLSIHKELLLKKLNDSKVFFPYLDKILLSALTQYTWQLVEPPLAILDDDAPIIDIKPEQRVQIANRYQRRILVHKKSWQELSPEHQVALVIHEAVFSLIEPRCNSSQCWQPGYLAREIVGLLFTNPNLAVSPPSIAHVRSVLGLASLAEETNRVPTAIVLQLMKGGIPINKVSAVKGVDSFLRELMIRDFCNNAERVGSKGNEIQIELSRLPFYLEPLTYLSQTAQSAPQTWLKACPQQSRVIHKLPVGNNCAKDLRFIANNWFSNKPL